jgi:molybdate/tungstate transport system ATP-binding protein
LTVASGEYFILLGPTGAGKTLLLETIMGFHKPDEGKIFMDETDVTDFPPEKRNIGYVPQHSVLFPHMNVYQNIEFGLKVRHFEQAKRKSIIQDVMNLTSLTSLARHNVDTLSGGERQKLSLARVLAIQPNVILLDEPLTGMDAQTATEFKRELKRIHRAGKTIVHVTHNQMEGFSLGERMAIIRKGQIVQTGKTRDVISRPRDEYVARFLGYENVFRVRLERNTDSTSLVRAENAILEVAERVNTAECTIAFRPEDLEVNVAEKSATPANFFEGIVVDLTDQGRFVAITFNAGLTLHGVITRSAFVEKPLEIGMKVKLFIEPSRIKVLDQTLQEPLA